MRASRLNPLTENFLDNHADGEWNTSLPQPAEFERETSRNKIQSLELHPREQLSFEDTVSRLRKGWSLRTRQSLLTPWTLTNHKSVRCAAQFNPSGQQKACCGSKLSGRFPSVASNCVCLDRKGNVCVYRRRRSYDPEVAIDLLDLPCLPCRVIFEGNKTKPESRKRRRRTFKVNIAELDQFIASRRPHHVQLRDQTNEDLDDVSHASIVALPPVRPVHKTTGKTLDALWAKISAKYVENPYQCATHPYSPRSTFYVSDIRSSSNPIQGREQGRQKVDMNYLNRQIGYDFVPLSLPSLE
ncbi:hypothetical protein CSKR_202591 [Clonorchis sinensis]|uniref:Uncharacterized protein n=2 Tax=Clonorchis sinensis TaxID=79923 RepID=A0A8T1M173_CLOSI|nr:hypothetical protein CSKR_202591 [Clonorchis sinensis]GAA52912.1 hypothetical protein CLF_109079 [Clonorchis sinensis]